MLSDITVPDRRAPGCEKKSLEMAVQQNLVPFDYEQKKILAAKVIQGKPSTNDYRVPTSAWSGYGLSQSIPPINTSDIKKVSVPLRCRYKSVSRKQYWQVPFSRRNLPPPIHLIYGRNQRRRYSAERLTLESDPVKTVLDRSA